MSGKTTKVRTASRLLVTQIVLIPVIAALNYVTGSVVTLLRIPLWLDTWATTYGVLIAPIWVGILGGCLYNIIMGLTLWGIPSIIWMYTQILLGLMTWWFYRIGRLSLKKPATLVAIGLLMGAVNQALGVPTIYLVYGGLPAPAGGGVWMKDIIFAAILSSTGIRALALFLCNLPQELVDKTIALIISVAILARTPKSLILKE